MKKAYIISIVISVLFITSCNKKETKLDEIIFKSIVEETLDYVINDNIKFITDTSYQTYNVDNGQVLTFIYDESSQSYNEKKQSFSKELKSGILQKNNNGGVYLSIEGNDYCAFKNLNDTEIQIYNISEKENCHIPVTMSNSLKVQISTFKPDSSDDTHLIALANLVDNYDVMYRWYRNDTLISNVTGMEHVIDLDYEDAEYYVEVITSDGQTAKSQPINIKIEK